MACLKSVLWVRRGAGGARSTASLPFTRFWGSISQQRILAPPRAAPKRCRSFSCWESEGIPRSHISSPPRVGALGVDSAGLIGTDLW
jgi:hypothetical protein